MEVLPAVSESATGLFAPTGHLLMQPPSHDKYFRSYFFSPAEFQALCSSGIGITADGRGEFCGAASPKTLSHFPGWTHAWNYGGEGERFPLCCAHLKLYFEAGLFGSRIVFPGACVLVSVIN